MNTARLARARAKTSIEILRERDALEERQREVDLALDTIEDEIDEALHHPEIAILALCRIGAMVRRARGSVSALSPGPESGVRKRSSVDPERDPSCGGDGPRPGTDTCAGERRDRFRDTP